MAAGNENDPQASTIAVLSTDPEKKEEKQTNGDAKGKGKEESDVPDIVRYSRAVVQLCAEPESS